MNIRRAIELAREISDQPNVLVGRANLLSRANGAYDRDGEDAMLELERKVGYSLKVVDVGIGVHQAVKKNQTVQSISYCSVQCAEPLRDAIYGYVLKKGDSAIVVYKDSLNFCWKRFTIVKELSHLYSGTVTNSITQGAAAITFAAKESRRIVPTLDTELDAETAAFYIALEIMVPWRLRRQFNDLRAAGATTYQLAKAFMIPQSFIAHFTSDWNDKNTYAGLSFEVNSKIDEERRK